MKVTVVPAQVTTLEDRIAGRLGLSQLLLLSAPVFGGSALYMILPPGMHPAIYKLVVIGLLMFTCSLLAIRIKGKILLLWLVVLLRYRFRPRYYVFNKNVLAHREVESPVVLADEAEDTEQAVVSDLAVPKLSLADFARAQAIIDNPEANFAFATSKKGGLSVLFNEVND